MAQSEHLILVSAGTLTLPEREGKLGGTNRGTLIGPIMTPSIEDEWKATVKRKRDIYGKRHRVAVGGKVEGSARRKDEDVDAVFHFASPPALYEDLLHRFFVQSVLDMTPGSGVFAATCASKRVGYFGICMTEQHKTELQRRVVISTLNSMMTQGSDIYDPKAASALGKASTTTTPKPSPPPPKPTAPPSSPHGDSGSKRKRKPKGAAKATASAAAPAADGGSAELSELSEGDGESDWSL